MWAGNDITKSTWYSNYPSADESAMDDYVTMNDYVTMSDDGGMDGTDQYTDMADNGASASSSGQDAIVFTPEQKAAVKKSKEAAAKRNPNQSQFMSPAGMLKQVDALPDAQLDTYLKNIQQAATMRANANIAAREEAKKNWFQRNPLLSVVLAGGTVIGAVALFSKMSRR